MRDARMLADRIVTYLRSIQPHTVLKQAQPPPVAPPSTDPARAFVVRATEWRTVVRTDELNTNIEVLVHLIEEVIRHTTTANLPPEDRALTEIERAQLIAVLETALHILRSPMMERGFLKKAGEMLKRAAAKAVEKQVENAFAFAAGYATAKITEILPHL